MGYNVLSGSVSSIAVIQSGSFSGDGSGLENVEQFELQNASAARIPFYKTISGELGLNANSGFTFNSSTSVLSVPNLAITKGMVFARRQVTSTITASSEDFYIGVSASAPIIIQMTDASTLSNGQTYIIKDEAGNANNYIISIKTSGSQTIDGETTIVLESPYASVNLYSNGVDKFFIY